MKNKFIFLLFPIIFSSCSFGSETQENKFLNYKYVLNEAGDLHGLRPTSNEVLNRNSGFTSYISLFNKNESYINFQCYGSSFDTFYCETTFQLLDKDNKLVFGGNNYKFKSKFSGSDSGKIIIEDDGIKSEVGEIYVYTPYWCRWQFEYDVNGDGEKVLLTFEFWKKAYNNLPEWGNNV